MVRDRTYFERQVDAVVAIGDPTNDMCTPRLRCSPEQFKHMKTPWLRRHVSLEALLMDMSRYVLDAGPLSTTIASVAGHVYASKAKTYLRMRSITVYTAVVSRLFHELEERAEAR